MRRMTYQRAVYRVTTHIHQLDETISDFDIHTDIPWVDFHSRCSAKLDRPAAVNELLVRHSRMKGVSKLHLTTSEGWTNFIKQVADVARTARTVFVTVDVWCAVGFFLWSVDFFAYRSVEPTCSACRSTAKRQKALSSSGYSA
jgi:hypothetical protein